MAIHAQQTYLKVLRGTTRPQVAQAVDLFLLDGEVRNLSPRTLHWYRENLEPFVAFLVQEQDIETVGAITQHHIRAYLATIQQAQRSAYTEHGHARAIRAFLNFCVNEDLLAYSPMRKVRMPKLPDEILPAFSPEQALALIDQCKNLRESAAILCLLDTGVRAAEFCTLTIGDVDLKTGTVHVRLGKGAKDRTVFLGKRALRVMMKYVLTQRSGQPTTAPLWANERTGEAITLSGLRDLLHRIGDRAGIPRSLNHPHTYRRTFALWSLDADMDVVSLARLLGHSSLVVVQKYLAQREKNLRDKHARHGAVDNML